MGIWTAHCSPLVNLNNLNPNNLNTWPNLIRMVDSGKENCNVIGRGVQCLNHVEIIRGLCNRIPRDWRSASPVFINRYSCTFGMMVLTLYHCPPSYPSRAAFMVARAVGVDITVKTVNLFKADHLSPEFTKINPQHTVPTLTDDEFVLWDSHAIASYLVRTYASDDSLYPQDPKQKAVVDQRLYFNAGILFPRLREICVSVLWGGRTTVDETQKATLREAVSYLDIFLEGSPWVAGSNMTIADFACVAPVSSMVALGLDISAYKNVTAWLARCQSEMPGYEEVNEPGAEELRNAVCSRLQGNKF